MMPTPPPCFLQPLLFSLTSLLPSLYLYSCFLFTSPLSPFFPRLLPSFLRTPSFLLLPRYSCLPLFSLLASFILSLLHSSYLPTILPTPSSSTLSVTPAFSPSSPYTPSSLPSFILSSSSSLLLSSTTQLLSHSLLLKLPSFLLPPPFFLSPPILPSPPSYFIFSSPPLSSPIFEGWGIYMVTTSQKLKNSSPL